MISPRSFIDLRDCKVEPVVTNRNGELSIGFYEGENLILQVLADTFDLSNLPDAILANMGEKTTDQMEEKVIGLEFENEELKNIIEQFRTKTEYLIDKYNGDFGPL